MGKTAIKFHQLWDCCWGNETHVATFFEDDGVTPAYHAVCTKCANQFRGETRPITKAELATFEAEPRKSGDLCYSGYWGKFYLVLNVDNTGLITVLWLGNQESDKDWVGGSENVTVHRTAWDWRIDKFVDFNLLASMDEDTGYADYDEFLAVMRDCADYAIFS